MNRWHVAITVMSLAMLASACTRVSKTDDTKVALLVHERVDREVSWHQQEKEPVKAKVDEMLKTALTQDAAVQIALLNNPEIQAEFEELGIKQADLIQAGLFQNPLFEGFVRFPTQRSFSTNTGFSVVQGFIDVFLIPLRKKVIATELQQTELFVAERIIDLAFEVQECFVRLQQEVARRKVIRSLIDTAKAANLLAERQRKAGNINELTQQIRWKTLLETKLELATVQNSIIALRQKMQKLLGLTSLQASWQISDLNREVPTDEPALASLQAAARANRLDLASKRLEQDRLIQMGATKEWWSYTDPTLGISGEKDTDGAKVIGPAFSVVLPLFDHGQAERARLEARLLQSEHRLHALELEVEADVRQAYQQLKIDRERLAVFENQLVPLQKKIISSSQAFYNVMGLSIYTFLHNKEQALRTEIGYTDALCNYLLTRIELFRAVGGDISANSLYP